jgi:cytochrome c553
MKTSMLVMALAAFAATTAMVKADTAADNWDKQCAKCHGADGKGATKMGQKMGIKDLTDAKYQASFTDDKAFKAIKEGIKDGDTTKMKAFDTLSDDDIKALVAKVRAFKS